MGTHMPAIYNGPTWEVRTNARAVTQYAESVVRPVGQIVSLVHGGGCIG
jgi:hypothetical protein